MPTHYSVKESVFPFNKFPGVDIILGPGDAIDRRGDGHRRQLPDGVRQEPDGGQQRRCRRRARCSSRWPTATRRRWCRSPGRFAEMGYQLIATRGTARFLRRARHRRWRRCRRSQEGRPNLHRQHEERRGGAGHQHAERQGSRTDEGKIRAAAVAHGVTCITTLSAAGRGRGVPGDQTASGPCCPCRIAFPRHASRSGEPNLYRGNAKAVGHKKARSKRKK